MPKEVGMAAEPKFEKDLEKLEGIVESLEEGGLALDASIKKFEEGIKLAKRCETALNSAEKKIEVLTKNASGKVETEAFQADDESKEEEEEDEAEEEESDGDLLF